jgi:nitroreductase
MGKDMSHLQGRKQVQMTRQDVLSFLKQRRSVLARNMTLPGPDAAQLEELLTVAARVPDHGKLAPWRFIVLEGAARAELGDVARDGLAETASDAEAQAAQAQFTRAPCVIGVLATPVLHPKIPRSEQLLSAGAACMTFLTAAQAMGFAAQWLTGAAAYDDRVKARLGGTEEDEIAGFIYIGTASEPPSERPRPALEDIVTYGLVE